MRLTRYELELMEILWKLGRASVREVQERLPDDRRPAYTTVQTMIYRLEEKGAVKRTRKIGNAHVFEPAVTRKAARKRVVEEVLSWFGGSARPLVAHLVEFGKLSLEDIREMEKELARRGKGGKSA
jgi:BlaI family penicillinase repressor